MAATVQGYKPIIELNVDQIPAAEIARKNSNTYHLFYGGGGSGKSFFIQYIILSRALRAPNSRHGIFRLTRASCEKTLFDKTLLEVVRSVFPSLLNDPDFKINLSDMSVDLPNGSKIFYDGLDENRIQKVLGDEFQTIWLNECNEFSYKQVSILVGRLRGEAIDMAGRPIKNKMFFDCNPRSKKDWDYRAFVMGVNPDDNTLLENPDEWVMAKLNPLANIKNVGEDYVKNMNATMSESDKKRYIKGEWANDNPDALFKTAMFDDNRRPVKKDATVDGRLEAAGVVMRRIVVAVDPAVTNNKNSDETGIIVAGLGADGRAYILEDASGKWSPDQWANKAYELYKKWDADRVVAERNQGGDMVASILRKAFTHLPIKLVHASKGKVLRAEPVSAVYEQNNVSHVGSYPELEEQMCEFGMPGLTKSPDRLDALVWALTELLKLKGGGPPSGVSFGRPGGRTR